MNGRKSGFLLTVLLVVLVFSLGTKIVNAKEYDPAKEEDQTQEEDWIQETAEDALMSESVSYTHLFLQSWNVVGTKF